MLKGRLFAVCAGSALVVALGTLTLSAQESGTAKKGGTTEAKAAPKASAAARRVPPHFTKLNITAEQRQQIYEVRGKYRERLAALQAQIDQLESEELAECEKVLTETQRKLLDQIRAAAKEKPAPATGKSTAPAAKPAG
jgi:Spy/CpxP family protein refolding chaperone